MNREVLLGKLETCVPNNDTKLFIDSIFDFSDEDIVSLTEEELNRIYSISKQINMENVDEFFEYLWDEGDLFLEKAANGLDELNNSLLSRFYFGLYISLFKENNKKLSSTKIFHEYIDYANAAVNTGIARVLIAEKGVEVYNNLKYSIQLFQIAKKILPSNSIDCARAEMNEGIARSDLADIGVDEYKNLKSSIRLHKRAKKIFPQKSADYSRAALNEGAALLKLAEKGFNAEKNLKNTITLCNLTEKIVQSTSITYACSLVNKGIARKILAQRKFDTENNLKKAIHLFQKANQIFPPKSTNWARAAVNEGGARTMLGMMGIDTENNLKISMQLNQKVKEFLMPVSKDYAYSAMNEGVTRTYLALRGVETESNLKNAIQLYQSGRRVFPSNSLSYARVTMNEALSQTILAEMGIESESNLKIGINLYFEVISILEKLKDDWTYSYALKNFSNYFILRFRKTGDRKYLEDAKKILEDAETKIKDRKIWNKKLIQAKLHEIKANLLEFEGKIGISKAAREYNEAYKLTRIPYYHFMDEFSRVRIDIDERAFCKLVDKWKKIEKESVFLDYYDYSIYECHLEKTVDCSGIKREDEFRLARKKLEEIRDRTQIKIIKDRVSAYVFLMNALIASFRKESYDDAKENIRQACRIFDKYDDKDGSKTCNLFSDAVIKNKDPEAWREILRHKSSLSCNLYRLISEGADWKEKEARLGTLQEDVGDIKDKIDDISIKIGELKTELNSGFERIKEKVEQGFECENEQCQDINNGLDDTQLKLEKLAEISKRSKGKEGDSIRQFSKQILQLLENEDSEALERFVKEVINNEESLITEIDDSTMSDKEKTKAKGFLKKFKKIPTKAKKEAGTFGKNVSYNLATALMAEEIIKHIFPLISTAIIGVPIPSHLLELLSKAIPKK